MKTYKALPEFYDAEYERNPVVAEDVPFLLDHLPRRSQRILELAVGTARAAIPLVQSGHRVVGVDNDPAMLELARHKRDAVGIPEKKLQLIEQDVLKLDLPDRFDWAVILFNTFLNFTTLSQQDALLSGIARHLRPRGRLWIDIFHPDHELLAADQVSDLDPIVFHVPARDLTVQRTTELRAHPVEQVQHVTLHYQWFEKEGRPRSAEVRFQLTYLFPRELRLLLERNGFVVEQLYGDYDATPPDRDSPRLIALGRLK